MSRSTRRGTAHLSAHLSRVITTAALAGLLVAPVACHNGPQPQNDDDQAEVQEPTTLDVMNQGFPDMTIYVVQSGQRIRLGLATGNATVQFVIPRAVVNTPATQLRFIADPIGGSRAPVSDEITVSPGDHVQLTIPAA
jgi:hypothetical protein